MPALGLAFLGLYALVAVVLRMAVQLRRTGSTGYSGLGTGPGFHERICGAAILVAIGSCVTGLALELGGAVRPVQGLGGAGVSVLGAVLAAGGIVSTVVAQFAMGDSWRIGVDPCERTELVTGGPFVVVRNPIFAAMIPSFVGIALVGPNVLTLAGAIVLVVSLQLQTRLIEEPYLLAVHGEPYAAYAARVGRFLPGIGRLRLTDPRAASDPPPSG